MSIASRDRPGVTRVRSADSPAAVGIPLLDDEPPFVGREELNPWHPSFDTQLLEDLEEFEEGREDGPELDENTFPPPPGAGGGIVLARAPVLDPRHVPLVHTLSAEILEEISGRERFLTVDPEDIHEAAVTFGLSLYGT